MQHQQTLGKIRAYVMVGVGALVLLAYIISKIRGG